MQWLSLGTPFTVSPAGVTLADDQPMTVKMCRDEQHANVDTYKGAMHVQTVLKS